VVLGHGIHFRGIDEPRLIRFARHLADRGIRVLTPELSDLADYRVTENGVEVLRKSVAYLAEYGDSVGLIGFSFAGGLALLAAEDPATAKHLEYVASIGGYHDLGRTLRFLATDHVEGPEGSFERDAHEYGLLVLLYGHIEQLGFGADEKPLTRVLRAWLKEDRPQAREAAKELTTERGRLVYDLLEKGKMTQLSREVLPILEKRGEELARLSPKGRLGRIRAPLLFLHGAGDTVVPPEETLWADRELQEGSSRGYLALSTPLLEHVHVDHSAGLYEQWKLVHLVAHLL
jgi:dienelactone hydrolase